MRILILSDNHYESLSAVNSKDYSNIIHCGDYGKSYQFLVDNNVNFVCGNCDTKGEKIKEFDINQKHIIITHGDLFGVKYDYTRLTYLAEEKKANYVFFGHTHRPDIFTLNGITYINPGAYQDGYSTLITDDEIEFIKDGRIYKRVENRW